MTPDTMHAPDVHSAAAGSKRSRDPAVTVTPIGTLGSTGLVLRGQDEILQYRILGDCSHIAFNVNQGSAVVHGLACEVHRLPDLLAEERYRD